MFQEIEKTMKQLDRFYFQEGTFTSELREFGTNQFEFGSEVICVLQIMEDGTVRDYEDQTEETLLTHSDYQTYKSLEDWAWSMAQYALDLDPYVESGVTA